MAYCTQTDIENALREGATTLARMYPDGEGGVKEAPIADAIAYADGIIDTYIGTKFTTGVTSVSALAALKRHAVNLARWQLYLCADKMHEGYQKAHDQSIVVLRDIASGKGSLGTTDDPAAEESDSGIEASHSANNNFRTSLDGF
jgi:phage gp36-like protein